MNEFQTYYFSLSYITWKLMQVKLNMVFQNLNKCSQTKFFVVYRHQFNETNDQYVLIYINH